MKSFLETAMMVLMDSGSRMQIAKGAYLVLQGNAHVRRCWGGCLVARKGEVG